MTPIELAKHYFDMSNECDFDGIKSVFTESSTYCSGTGELFVGVKDILVMQRAYHGSFKTLNWQVNHADEIKPGIIVIDFEFQGKSLAEENVEYSGTEYIIVHDGKIQHIDVRRND